MPSPHCGNKSTLFRRRVIRVDPVPTFRFRPCRLGRYGPCRRDRCGLVGHRRGRPRRRLSIRWSCGRGVSNWRKSSTPHRRTRTTCRGIDSPMAFAPPPTSTKPPRERRWWRWRFLPTASREVLSRMSRLPSDLPLVSLTKGIEEKQPAADDRSRSPICVPGHNRQRSVC